MPKNNYILEWSSSKYGFINKIYGRRYIDCVNLNFAKPFFSVENLCASL